MINPFKLRKQLKNWQMLYSKQAVKFIECKCKFAEVLVENDQLRAEIKALKEQAYRAEMIARQQSALLDMAEKQIKKLRG
ncbi:MULTISPECIES: hypothetical protein [Actinobacillus]|uniref:Uncharacterized protein n=2 Tax=Actinobacillus suis TaxID=716 RepID=K0G358_ACTSU|nr:MULTISPECIES: hypothetical protein [Actinobacillus]AFU18656.1 hypothetical protein ASU2_02570 [Actinobacillus suis H91-0380]EFM95260.1 hypothetical protein appser10_21200 [Actinobacillus pleuropneumoniae serovar 10 str. D13039]MCO4167109.1 hypothetical protein [Actinobacillus suis]MCO4169232.1 hypothetical protein [Actinobacillus suis]MCQ9629836.1 hypothetical protein [Actinobacillus suis]